MVETDAPGAAAQPQGLLGRIAWCVEPGLRTAKCIGEKRGQYYC